MILMGEGVANGRAKAAGVRGLSSLPHITLPSFEINRHFPQPYIKCYQRWRPSICLPLTLPQTLLCGNPGAAVNGAWERAEKAGKSFKQPRVQWCCEDSPSFPGQTLSQGPSDPRASKLSRGQKEGWGAAALETSAAWQSSKNTRLTARLLPEF